MDGVCSRIIHTPVYTCHESNLSFCTSPPSSTFDFSSFSHLSRPRFSLQLTLVANGIPDESDEFEKLSIRDDYYVPVVHLYYNDDLTVA